MVIVMAKQYAKAFYKSAAWENCRSGYLKSVGGLCERCLKQGLYNPGVIVHHKIHLTPDNIVNPEIALDYHNLELLCMDCHNKEHTEDRLHFQKRQKRYFVDEFGRVTAAVDAPCL